MAAVGAILLSLTACGDDDEAPRAAPTTTAPEGIESDSCLVRVHGRSETGAEPRSRDGYLELAPIGSVTSGDGHMWQYDTGQQLADGVDRIRAAVDAAGCEHVALHGFSNGGGFTGAMICSGEDLGGRLVGAVIDDPVPDQGAVDCQRDPDLPVVVYWTGSLTDATPGRSCASLWWECAGETLVGIDAYAEALGVAVTPSPHDDHVWYDDPPEVRAYLELPPG